jgi:hypothetical protein
MTRFENVAVEIAKGVAVDKQTAQAMAGGAAYKPPQEAQQPTHYAPPPLRPVPVYPHFEDLTGLRFERLLVLGLAAIGFDGKKARWSCRCTCGKYSTHRGLSLRRGSEDRCHDCHITRIATDGIGGRCVSCGGLAKFMPYCGKCGKANGRPDPSAVQADSKEAKDGARP